MVPVSRAVLLAPPSHPRTIRPASVGYQRSCLIYLSLPSFYLACNSPCGACAGSPTFCLTCVNNQLASGGTCVSNCPSNTFSSAGSCLTCHPDCTSCSGGSFNQCTSCPSNRPVLTNGRCLPTCSQSQFFDSTSSTCQSCDSSCSSCSGSGPDNCLACSSSTQVLVTGSCVAANCSSASNVVAGLGVCLSDLVVPRPSGTSAPPLPSVTGLNEPTVIMSSHRLTWWQILLMSLGCAFIFLVVIWLFRRRQRKKRAKGSAKFAMNPTAKKGKTGWRWKFLRFGEKIFCHTRSRRVHIVHLGPSQDESELNRLRMVEEARHPTYFNAGGGEEEEDIVKLIGLYNQPYSSEASRYHSNHHDRAPPVDQRSLSDASQHSAPSMYSQVTGVPRKAPDPRQPLKSRFSMSTFATNDRQQDKHAGKNTFWK